MPTIVLKVSDIDALLGTYGNAPALSLFPARRFLEKLYGKQIQLGSYGGVDDSTVQVSSSDLPTLMDMYSKFYFSGSPCIAIEDAAKLMEITKGLKPDEFRVVMADAMPIVCFKDATLAMKVKLSIDNTASS